MLFEPAAASSLLAFVTTLHLAGAALRNHRSAGGTRITSLALVSFALAGTPWLFPSAYGLVFGGLVHVAWFIVCERFATVPPASAGGAAHHRTPSTGLSPATASAAAPGTARRGAPRGFIQTPVLCTFDETPTIRTIRMLRPEGCDFDAGQFVPVRIRVDGREYVRCYSISSAPHAPGYLEISVKRQGLVSNALHSTARPGSILTIKAPNGAFRYPAGDDRPLLLLAGGVGITPLMSMLRWAVQAEPTRPIALLYSCADTSEFAFGDELDSMVRRHPQVTVVRCVTRQTVSTPAYYPGRIDAALLGATVPDLAHRIACICGPAPMIDSLRTLLADLGMPPAQVRHEVFEAAVAAAAGAGRGSAVPDQDEPVAMRCLPDERTVPVTPGQSLLEAAEHGGVEIPSLCRAGVCGTCRVRVTAGEVACDTTTLDASDRGQGYVLACVARALSDCTVQR